MVSGRRAWSEFLSWGREVTPQVPPGLAVLSGVPQDLKHNLCSPRLPRVGLAAAARPASVDQLGGGKKAEKKGREGQWSPCSSCGISSNAMSVLTWLGPPSVEDLNNMLITSKLSFFVYKMEITLVPTPSGLFNV